MSFSGPGCSPYYTHTTVNWDKHTMQCLSGHVCQKDKVTSWAHKFTDGIQNEMGSQINGKD